MTDNVLPMPPRAAVSGVQFAASFVVRDDKVVVLYIPLWPDGPCRRLLVHPTYLALTETEGEGSVTATSLLNLPAALLWLANRGPRP